MRKRNIQKIIRFDEKGARDLERKARKVHLSESALIRVLLLGYEPKEQPDQKFYDTMRELSAIGNNINQIAIKANALDFIDSEKLKAEALRWHQFQADVEATYLRPDNTGNRKWQDI